MRRLFIIIFLTAFAATVLLAADFWTTKEFAEWNDKEVKKILTNSPWAKTQDVTVGARLPAGGGGGRRGGGGGGGMPGGGGGGGGRSGGGGGGGGGEGMSMPSMRIYMRWISALPVRQAIVRRQYGNETSSPEAQKFLSVKDERYVLVVIGLPVNMAGSRGGSRGGGSRGGGGETGGRPDPAEFQKRTTDNLMANAVIKIKGKEPAHPSQVQVSGTQEQPEIYMAFPTAKDGGFDITLEAKDVEFELKLRSGNTVRRKFRLKDMVYNGKLEI
jgi:hypothetical protein